MFVHEKSNFFFIEQNDKPISGDRLFNIKVMYTKTSFGKKFINFLGTVNFNSLPSDIKKIIFLMIILT